MNENQMTFPTLFDLFQHWCNDNYPDYVTGIWSNDGSSYNLTVGVVEGAAGEAGKQEILDLIENDASVTFVTQTYSRNYLLQIQENLLPYFEQEELGMVANGLHEKENYINIEIHTDKANSEASLNFIAELKSTYGDAVSFEYTDTVLTLTLQEVGLGNPLAPSVPGEKSFSPLLVAGLIGIPLLVFGTWFVLRKRFVPVMQTTTGATVTPTDTHSVKEIKGMVRESSLTVSKELDERVMNKIIQQKK